jgi:hypothetical protein
VERQSLPGPSDATSFDHRLLSSEEHGEQLASLLAN